MIRFKVTNQAPPDGPWMIVGGCVDHLHSDGSVYHQCPEYWPEEAQARAVLDKFQPEHVWMHGDVFRTKNNGSLMIHLVLFDGPVVYILEYSGPDKGAVSYCLEGATFLFNVRDKSDG